MTVIIDNYDSFSYNLVQLVGQIDPDLKVIRNDEMTVQQIEQLHPSRIILSPGPGRPKDAGICEEVILYFYRRLPILGVCLGHQAICEAFGADIGYARTLMHGKMSSIHIANGSAIFRGLPPILEAARYHSLSVKRSSLPEELLVIAEDDFSEVMAVKHKDYDVFGLQFHPESILTPKGHVIIENFLKLGGGRA